MKGGRGGQRLHADEAGVSEQAQLQQRAGDAALDAHEGHGQHGRCQQRAQYAGTAPAGFGRQQHAAGEQAQRAGEAQRAAPVEPAAHAGGRARTLAATSAAPSRPTRPVARNTQCHPAASTSQPEASGPKDRPMPKVVPSRLKARARAAPWNSGASEDMAAARRPRRPCLDQPQHVHPEDRRRQRQQESGGAEQRQSQQPDAARADQVDQAAGHHDDAAIGQDVAVEHPVQLDGRAAQGLADGRQHHGRAGEAEWNEQGGQAGGKQLQPAPGSRGNGVRVSRHVAGSQEERRAWRHGPGKNRGWPLKKTG